uniref:Uncharacterized protein n=1 Tax=Anopheles maculatus TaxID=74869 RepID=A0A182SHX1_9DIPT
MYSPPIMYGIFPETRKKTTGKDSTNLTTTEDPAASTTVETSTLTTTVKASVDNATVANGTVEYEDVNEAVLTPPDYDYQEEGNSTTRATIVPAVTEPTLNGTSTMGPNMIRKRRKKVTTTTSATTPGSTNPGVVRIKLRRKITTTAPVTEAVTENGF